jgi:alpha-beta hydrolase superfamily lysophospholipase
LAELRPISIPITASDGYEWHYCRFLPAGGLGEVVVLHGIQSHSGWYHRTALELTSAGYSVSLLDRRGCGINERGRGDALSFRRLLDDIAEYMAELQRPRFLVGISWGGKLAVALQRRHPGLTNRLVLIAPGLRPRVRPPFGDRLRIFTSQFLSPGRQFPIPLNEPELFTANHERQEFIRQDPLALREASARLLFESARMDVYLRFAVRHVTMPVLLLLAGQDRIIDNSATRRFCERFPTTDRTVIEYANAHHTLEFEPAGPPFLSDLLGWLEKRSS